MHSGLSIHVSACGPTKCDTLNNGLMLCCCLHSCLPAI